MKHSVQCSQCGAARPVDTDTWSLEEPCEECEHGEDSAQVNSRTTFCQHSVNMVSTISRCVQEELLERYRELVSLVAGLECGLEEHSYNYLHTWAAAALGEVRP